MNIAPHNCLFHPLTVSFRLHIVLYLILVLVRRKCIKRHMCMRVHYYWNINPSRLWTLHPHSASFHCSFSIIELPFHEQIQRFIASPKSWDILKFFKYKFFSTIPFLKDLRIQRVSEKKKNWITQNNRRINSVQDLIATHPLLLDGRKYEH